MDRQHHYNILTMGACGFYNPLYFPDVAPCLLLSTTPSFFTKPVENGSVERMSFDAQTSHLNRQVRVCLFQRPAML